MNIEHIWMDQGIQTFRMLLVPHTGTWQSAGIPRVAEEFISPSFVIYQGIHKGKMPKSGSFLSVNAGNLIVSAVKHSEKGEDLIIRVVETAGEKVSATVSLTMVNKSWTGDFNPYEIKTLRYIRQSGDFKVVSLLEE
jgi:alpha-mannosidase